MQSNSTLPVWFILMSVVVIFLCTLFNITYVRILCLHIHCTQAFSVQKLHKCKQERMRRRRSVQLLYTYGCHQNTKYNPINTLLFGKQGSNSGSRKKTVLCKRDDIICILMQPELHAPSPPSAAHVLLVQKKQL